MPILRHLAIIFLAIISTASAQASGVPTGLWVWTAEVKDNARQVSIVRTGAGWRGTNNGQLFAVENIDGTISFELTSGESFVGTLTDDGLAIEGVWRQPSTPLAYAEMVTPVDLRLAADGRWEADFEVQARPFRVFLDIFEDEEGELAAVIRNPERNEIMRTPRFRLEPEGTQRWNLVAGSGGRQIRQSLQHVDDRLIVEHSWFEEPLEMRLAQTKDLNGYFPRDPSDGPQAYTPPPQLGDGWTVATAEEAGFDPSALDDLVAALAAADPRSRRPRLIHSMLVSHRGRLVIEEYFFGYDRETAHDTRSLGKVFAPVLIGALRNDGADIDSGVRPIADVFAAAGEDLDDPRKSDIKLAHLLTFTSGLDCNGNDPDSLGAEDRMWAQEEEENFWLFTARLPLLHQPGTRYAYCSGSMNLVGASIRAAGGRPIIEIFDKLIAEPLEFGPYHWNVAPDGAAYLGGGPYMRPRDLLKVAATYASGGRWHGQQIVDPAWVDESTTAYIDITPETTGLSAEEFGNTYFGGTAAYEWRIDTVRAGERTYRSYEASGNGGQLMIVVPDLELAVVFTGGNYGQGGIWGRWRNEIVGGYIIPAMVQKH